MLEFVPSTPSPAPAAMSSGVEQSRSTKDPPPDLSKVPPTATDNCDPAASAIVVETITPRALEDEAPAAITA